VHPFLKGVSGLSRVERTPKGGIIFPKPNQRTTIWGGIREEGDRPGFGVTDLIMGQLTSWWKEMDEGKREKSGQTQERCAIILRRALVIGREGVRRGSDKFCHLSRTQPDSPFLVTWRRVICEKMRGFPEWEKKD